MQLWTKFRLVFCQSDEFEYRPKKLGQQSSKQRKNPQKKKHSEVNFIIWQVENLKNKVNENFRKNKICSLGNLWKSFDKMQKIEKKKQNEQKIFKNFEIALFSNLALCYLKIRQNDWFCK